MARNYTIINNLTNQLPAYQIILIHKDMKLLISESLTKIHK